MRDRPARLRSNPVLGILIADNKKLWFYSVDGSDPVNTEVTKPEDYNVDPAAPTVAITAPMVGGLLPCSEEISVIEDLLLPCLLTIEGSSSDVGTGIDTVELQISGGGEAVLVTNGQLATLESGDPPWVMATDTGGGDWSTWSYTTPVWKPDTTYTIVARATDSAGNSTSTTRSFHHFNGDPFFTIMSLNVTTSSIIFGGSLRAAIKLTVPGALDVDACDPDDYSGACLNNSEVWLDVAEPCPAEGSCEGRVVHTIGPFVTDEFGGVTVDNLGAVGNKLLPDDEDLLFKKKGTWTLQAKFDETLALAAATSDPQILLVGTSARI